MILMIFSRYSLNFKVKTGNLWYKIPSQNILYHFYRRVFNLTHKTVCSLPESVVKVIFCHQKKFQNRSADKIVYQQKKFQNRSADKIVYRSIVDIVRWGMRILCAHYSRNFSIMKIFHENHQNTCISPYKLGIFMIFSIFFIFEKFLE